MERMRITEASDEMFDIPVTIASTTLYRQPLAHDLGKETAQPAFRCCGCAETPDFFNEIGLGFLYVKAGVVCCALCEAEAQQRVQA
jgi:hypothetical protein